MTNPESAWDLGEGATPFFKADKLGKHLGLRHLWIKDESANPTNTFKVREAGLTLARFREIGIRKFVLYSTGNTAAGFTYGLSRAPIFQMHLFVPITAKARINFDTPSNVGAAFLDADYFKTIERADKYASESGIPSEGGFGNICRRGAMKALSFEIYETSVKPDFYLQSIASGVGPYGVHKGFVELEEMGFPIKPPHLVCVQPENCAPIVNAYKKGLEDLPPDLKVDSPKTIASTLANGNPTQGYPYLKRLLDEARGIAETVTEEEIVEGGKLLNLERLNSEPAVWTAVAGLKKCIEVGNIDASDVVVLNNTGGYRVGTERKLPMFSLDEASKKINETLTRSITYTR
ncbi:MAG: pyridoxal-phosphate dependent enzyme [Candidatus Bathyarchaeia archaeon]